MVVLGQKPSLETVVALNQILYVLQLNYKVPLDCASRMGLLDPEGCTQYSAAAASISSMEWQRKAKWENQ